MYYYNDGENEIGPFSLEKLIKLRESGLIADGTLIRLANSSSWMPLNRLPEPNRKPELAGLDNVPPAASRDPNMAKNLWLNKRSAWPSATPTPINIHDQGERNPHSTENFTRVSGWISSPSSPWRRLGARILDTGTNGIVGFFLFGTTFYAIAPATADSFFSLFDSDGGRILDAMATSAIASFIGGALIGVTGFTLGKLIFGIQVVSLDGRKIGVLAGLSRDFLVLLKGLGLAIPIVSWVTMWISYKTLMNEGSTIWDKDRYIVLYRPNGPAQYVLNAIGIVMIILLIIMAGFFRSL